MRRQVNKILMIIYGRLALTSSQAVGVVIVAGDHAASTQLCFAPDFPRRIGTGDSLVSKVALFPLVPSCFD
jgi:hypothetical protein